MPRKIRRKSKIKASHIRAFASLFKNSKTPLRSIITILSLGIGIGIAYEEMVGVGTWHSFDQDTKKINLCFTPPSGCGGLIASQIAKTRSSIHMQAYGLTSPAIIYQLKAARNRGVRVSVLLDGGNLSDNNSVFRDLKNNRIDVYFDKMPGIAHNKVIILDKKKVITGSFNFTKSADNRNAENVLLINDSKIAQKYLNYWHSRHVANQ